MRPVLKMKWNPEIGGTRCPCCNMNTKPAQAKRFRNRTIRRKVKMSLDNAVGE